MAAVYLVLAAALLPPDEYLRAIGGGLLVFGAIWSLAAWLGRGRLPGLSIIAVAVASSVVLAFPTFPAMGGRHPAAVPIGFLGVEAAVLLPIAHLAVGRYLIGVLGGFCVYGAVAPIVSLSEREPLNLGKMALVAFLAGSLVGPAVALNTTDDMADADERAIRPMMARSAPELAARPLILPHEVPRQ